MTAANMPPMATPRVAAGALFFDEDGRVLLVKPSYKELWDVPGGYVEPGESPLAACIREVKEELAITPQIGNLLVVDWAPAEGEGDKLLFLFDGGVLTDEQIRSIVFADGELTSSKFTSLSELAAHLPDRLQRRVTTAEQARRNRSTIYAEHGLRTA